MKRSGIARKSSLSRNRLRAKPKPDDGYDDARAAVWVRSNRRCERCGRRMPAVAHCLGHAHHRLPRSAGRNDALSNLLALCGPCHQHVHANPEKSYREGLLIRRSDRRPPSMVPALLRLPDAVEWVLLDDGGGYHLQRGYEPLD